MAWVLLVYKKELGTTAADEDVQVLMLEMEVERMVGKAELAARAVPTNPQLTSILFIIML